jgi:cobalt/nickel transport system permease protein
MAQLHLDTVLVRERLHESRPARGVTRWDPRVKLVLLLVAIAANTWLALPAVSASVLAIGVVLLLWTRPPWRTVTLFFLAPLWATLIALAGYAVGVGHTPLATLGPLVITREGLQLGGQVALRAYCDIVWLALVFITTPFAQVLTALRWMRVPGILVDTLAMMYRYAFLLHDEFRRMRLAAQSRGGRSSRRREMQVIARIAAQIFLRAFDRSERIYWAMTARGGE